MQSSIIYRWAWWVLGCACAVASCRPASKREKSEDVLLECLLCILIMASARRAVSIACGGIPASCATFRPWESRFTPRLIRWEYVKCPSFVQRDEKAEKNFGRCYSPLFRQCLCNKMLGVGIFRCPVTSPWNQACPRVRGNELQIVLYIY